MQTHKIYRETFQLYMPNLSGTVQNKLLLGTLLTILMFNPSFTQTFDKAKLDQFLDRLNEKNKAMGSVLIEKDGKLLYNRSVGYSQINGTQKKPLTEATRYRIGSVTKMFSAAMIFQLIEEGKLKLDNNLDKFFPKIPNADKITIRHLLSHRSGIHDVSEDREFRTRRLNGMTKDELLTMINNSKPDFEPDTRYAYSNTGYQLLGLLIENLTGKSYQEAVSKRITSRIGLKDTYTGTGNIDPAKSESFSYRYTSQWEQQPETHMSLLIGSGSLISTAEDQAKFIQALFNGKIVSKESLTQITQNKLGIDTFTYNGKTAYGHTGGIDGFGSWLVYLPEEKLTVSYVTNGKVYPVEKIIDAIFDIYYNKQFTIPTFESIAVAPEVLKRYVGVYSISGTPVKFTVTSNDTTLFVQMPGQSPIPLEPITQDKFGVESAGIIFEFDTGKKQMIQKRGGRERVLTKEN